jgi:DNA-3-methyladenine glycosylase I
MMAEEKKMNAYCDFIKNLPPENVHRRYHDLEYGFPISEDDALFGRLMLEINQAGLSWDTILKKKENFFKAYDQFSIVKVAGYSEKKIERLLKDPGIIRNRLKVRAAVYNARIILGLQKESGSFKNWIGLHHPLTKSEWVSLFKKHFKFVGGEIVGEFLMSSGYLGGAHRETCPVFKQIAKLRPMWMQ